MSAAVEQCKILSDKLSLSSQPIGFRRFDRVRELDRIEGLLRWKQDCTFCQIPFMARVGGLTVGLTPEDGVGERCQRIHGLRASDDDARLSEARMLSRTWMSSVDEGLKQQEDYPRIPAGEAIVMGPVARNNFEPEVVLFYGNPAQIMMILCGLQKVKYERFQFNFIGEGACADSLAQCYVTGKPALAIPCYGERSLGQVKDDEIVLALPPSELDRAVKGLNTLEKIGFRYPISSIGAFVDPTPLLSRFYPRKEK